MPTVHGAGTGSKLAGRSTSKAQPPWRFMTMLARFVMVAPRVWLSISGAACTLSKKGISIPNSFRYRRSVRSMSVMAMPMCCMPSTRPGVDVMCGVRW
jgi:hypothetical protein